MYKKIFIFLFLFISSPHSYSQKSQVWMIGPMIHFNIGNREHHTSYGVELSWWNYEHFPYSFDGGMEFEKGKTRLYSEAQTGIGIMGISLGPVIEFGSEGPLVKAGIQGSAWCNYFGGIDLRFRKTGGKSFFSPGMYFKIPIISGEGSDGEFHDWDWDWDD